MLIEIFLPRSAPALFEMQHSLPSDRSRSAFLKTHAPGRHQHAAIDSDYSSGNERSPVAGKEGDGASHFFGSAHAAQWMRARASAKHGFRIGCEIQRFAQ